VIQSACLVARPFCEGFFWLIRHIAEHVGLYYTHSLWFWKHIHCDIEGYFAQGSYYLSHSDNTNYVSFRVVSNSISDNNFVSCGGNLRIFACRFFFP
jgi:hypothetical protein